MTIMREVDAKMITKEVLVVARVKARAETISQIYKKRWVGVNSVEVTHRLTPLPASSLFVLLHVDTESGGRPKLLKV
jgi:hypothetical protein